MHAEHGAGNNSAFVTKVVSSTGTDTYSAIAAAVGSLKGPKHGGANNRVIGMMTEIKENIKDWKNEEEISEFMHDVYRKLEWLSKEDLIKRIVSLEFNRFLDYYRDREEIKTDTGKKESNDEKGKKGRMKIPFQFWKDRDF